MIHKHSTSFANVQLGTVLAHDNKDYTSQYRMHYLKNFLHPVILSATQHKFNYMYLLNNA